MSKRRRFWIDINRKYKIWFLSWSWDGNWCSDKDLIDVLERRPLDPDFDRLIQAAKAVVRKHDPVLLGSPELAELQFALGEHRKLDR